MREWRLLGLSLCRFIGATFLLDHLSREGRGDSSMKSPGSGLRETVQTYFSHFPSFYDNSWPLVDAIVFTFVFVGLTRAVFEKRFPGRGGKAMIVGIGLILTIGMVWAEVEYGFSIKSFGPMAAGIVLLLLLTMLFRAGRAMGFSRTASLAFAAFLGLPTASQLIPGLTAFVGPVLPLILLVWFGSGALPGHSVWTKTPFSSQDGSGFGIPGLEFPRKEARRLKGLDRVERREIRDAYRQSKRVVKVLKHIRSNLERGGIRIEQIETFRRDLEKLSQSEHEMVLDLNALHETSKQLSEIDRGLLRDARIVLRGNRSGGFSNDGKAGQDISRELTLQEAIDSLASQCKKSDEAFVRSVRQAVSAIGRRRVKEAVQWIDHVLHWESKAQHILEDIRHVHRKAHSLLRRQIRNRV